MANLYKNRYERRTGRRRRFVNHHRLRRLLKSPDPVVRWDALCNVVDSEWKLKTLRLVRHTALHDPDYWVRKGATFALSFAWSHQWTAKPLLAIYKKAGEHPIVRAQASEGLANRFDVVKRWKPDYLPAMKALQVGLHDDSTAVRFWSVFALGNMRAPEALPELRRLAETDYAIYPGWWTVAEEAQDAIVSITGEGDVPARTVRRDTLTTDDICPYSPFSD